MTYREIAYMCLDELKIASDDSFYTIEHILFLLPKVRVALLEQKYGTLKKEISDSNYQTLCLDLIQVPAITGEPCEGGTFLRTNEKIPDILNIVTPKVYPINFYEAEFTLVSRERMRYVGYNRWLQNIIYCSIAPDDYMYFKSSNPQYLFLEKVRITGVFEDIEQAEKLSCDDSNKCDILDHKFPIEESLVPQVIDTIVKFLSSGLYKPEDTENNANDDLSTMMTFIRNNMKTNLQKQIEGSE